MRTFTKMMTKRSKTIRNKQQKEAKKSSLGVVATELGLKKNSIKVDKSESGIGKLLTSMNPFRAEKKKSDSECHSITGKQHTFKSG
jgi:hypothetical protein